MLDFLVITGLGVGAIFIIPAVVSMAVLLVEKIEGYRLGTNNSGF